MRSTVRAAKSVAAIAVALSLSLSFASPALADDPASITGTLTTNAGGPLASTRVAAEGINEIEGEWSQTTTDSAGTYTLSGLRPGTYVVSFYLADGLVKQYIPQQLINHYATAIHLLAGQTAVANDQALQIGAVSGRITEIDGSPAAGALVEAGSISYPGTFRADHTGTDGTFRIDGVVVGDYKVILTSQDEIRHQYVPGTTDPTTATVITVAAGADTTVIDQFIPTGSLRVTVTDAVTSMPIATPCVEVNGVGSGHRNATCGDSSVTLGGLPEGGGYEIAVTDDSWGMNYRSQQVGGIAVVAGQTTDVKVALTPRSPDEVHLPPDPG